MTSKKPKPYQFNSDTEYFLKKSCWYPGRNVSDKFHFPPEKKLFPAAFKVFQEFAYLDLEYSYLENRYREHGTLYMNEQPNFFDIFDMNYFILRKTHSLSHDKIETMSDDEKKIFIRENKLTDVTGIEKELGLQCCYLGWLCEKQWDTAFYVYVTEKGTIYLNDGCGEILEMAENFCKFLDFWMSRKRFTNSDILKLD